MPYDVTGVMVLPVFASYGGIMKGLKPVLINIFLEKTMKRLLFLFCIALAVGMVSPVLAEMPQTNFRVANISALGPTKDLNDDDIIELAHLGTAENPRLFPALTSLNLNVEGIAREYSPGAGIPAGSLKLSGSIDEMEKMEFISLPNDGGAGKYDLVIVKTDGTVIKIDDEVVINYKERTIKTYDPVTIEDGDVVIAFVRDVKEIYFGDKDKDEEPYRPGNDPHLQDRRGTTGGPGITKP
jgi:hypothetical protein